MILEKKYRFENLEFRWTKTLGKNSYEYPEIICWQKNKKYIEGIDIPLPVPDEFCYTLAYWVKDSEGWDLKFVGNRPFQDDQFKSRLFWELAHLGQQIVDAEYRMNRFMQFLDECVL
jgi:hypothetical protein